MLTDCLTTRGRFIRTISTIDVFVTVPALRNAAWRGRALELAAAARVYSWRKTEDKTHEPNIGGAHWTEALPLS
jgi:hypothetical protein